jgi:hypothetical protein
MRLLLHQALFSVTLALHRRLPPNTRQPSLPPNSQDHSHTPNIDSERRKGGGREGGREGERENLCLFDEGVDEIPFAFDRHCCALVIQCSVPLIRQLSLHLLHLLLPSHTHTHHTHTHTHTHTHAHKRHEGRCASL